jgi:flavin-binding protein dodecin
MLNDQASIRPGEFPMSEHTYKKVEIVGTSKTSTDDAIKNGLAKASKSLKNLDWFEVIETRGHIVDNEVAHFQVTMKVGFRLD